MSYNASTKCYLLTGEVMKTKPWMMLVAMMAGWINRQQQTPVRVPAALITIIPAPSSLHQPNPDYFQVVVCLFIHSWMAFNG